VVATPIGNFEDMSQRACAILGSVDLVAAEDTRRTRVLLSHIGVQAQVIAYHEHNEDTRSRELLARLQSGSNLALVSDAGTPLISDPGWRLVRLALDAGIPVRCVPGPSALTAALGIAGMPTDRFVFEGFLPRRAKQRAERLRALASESRTLVFFESVHRVPEMLAALVDACGGDRPASIARELTKLNEQLATGTLAELVAELGSTIPLLGEFVVIVAGNAATTAVEDAEIKRVYALLNAELPPGKAASLAAAILDVPRNHVYRVTRTQ
jgi:16S rRNA (cytidine1402-2'-O)-methyltransferase